MKAHEIARMAAALVKGARDESHGDKLKNFQNIATLWNAYLKIRPDPEAEISPLDHAHMMVLLKIARTQLGAPNVDDWIDAAGYAACAGEIATDLRTFAENVGAILRTEDLKG